MALLAPNIFGIKILLDISQTATAFTSFEEYHEERYSQLRNIEYALLFNQAERQN